MASFNYLLHVFTIYLLIKLEERGKTLYHPLFPTMIGILYEYKQGWLKAGSARSPEPGPAVYEKYPIKKHRF